MNIEKARKQALFAAIAAIVIGSVGALSVVLVYVQYGDWLNALSQQESNATTNAFLVKAVKAAGFRLVPALCVILIASGASTVFYFKKLKGSVPHNRR